MEGARDLLPRVYSELRKLANIHMARLRPGQSLQPTELVHEAYIRLVGSRDPGWNGRGHFFGAAARAMREILVDYARQKAALKRGGGQRRVELVTFAQDDVEVGMSAEDILTLDRAIEKMQQRHERKAEIVILRYFAGLTHEQIAESFGVSKKTIERDWQFAKAWLKKELSQS